ncbi:uncharacterized protein LOC120666416 [Panicum virgatum]|uniref:Uncharacterized protein n=1 Tax=Panicum virgatum TaxID=38727 RepID=A0A8T0UFD8_PANVG|nr:uncharacterized protein LOC120666416 [Panicum virgatum]KAG2621310.1 hypothetical protein PVAP13_3NG248863 [Panicum virgatum]
MDGPINIDDSRWDEVMFINGYAVFMGYLLMGVRGLTLLVVTWSTAVLGGYVDNLERKDFWSLTLIQTIRVSDFIIPETLRNVINSGWGLLAAIGSMIIHSSKTGEEPSNARWALAYGVFAVQLLVFAFLLCPLAILYVFGLFISAGISLWRLIDHDFGSIKEDSNMKPALEVLYSLAVAQGILFGYRFIYYHGAKRRIAKEVGRWYQLDQEIVLEYLREMVRECEKDPSFARGRNLVKYAADLTMKPNSRKSYLSGVRILGALLRPKHRCSGQAGLIKQVLTGSTSFSHVVRQLLETFGPTSPYSSEIREEAARIVALVAGSIRLEQFPGVAIHCISSLLDTFDEHIWQPEG